MNGEGIEGVNRKRVLDSFALLAYLNRETGHLMVKEALRKAQEAGESILMNEINIGETYYILHRNKGEKGAEYFLETILPGLPIQPLTNDLELVIQAAKIKAEYPLSFADCFAVASARREGAVVLTGDPEFKRTEAIVEIEWLPA
jgi:predicted nucleic acid-binding protein